MTTDHRSNSILAQRNRLSKNQYDDVDIQRLTRAIKLSEKCPKSSNAFSVGALLFDQDDKLIATGYSREVDTRDHAEEAAICKASEQRVSLIGGTIYSSLEPCGQRLSPRPCCVDRIIKAGIKKVVFALHEPLVFVEPTGAKKLLKIGIHMIIIEELGEQVKEINRHLF